MPILLCLAASLATDPAWPHQCTNSTAGYTEYNQTRCPDTATCCSSEFSASGQGCCPWPEAVCCENRLTCCPQGTRCVDTIPDHWPAWAAVTSCEPATAEAALRPLRASGAQTTAAVQGKCVCKPGAPLPMSTTLKNVVVIGDSVSLGYTPSVADIMSGVALVQHAPWGGDGGAEETAYGVQCLDYWLRGPAGDEIKPDLIFWNFGLHDGPQLFTYPPANVTIPGQEGNMSVYPSQLAAIADRLKQWSAGSGAKLLFGITTPMLADARADQDVVSLNDAAKAVMAAASIPTVDLHAAVVSKCGPAPQSSCFGIKGCFNPHCGGTATHIPGQPTKGYYWLANSTVVPAMKTALGLQ